MSLPRLLDISSSGKGHERWDDKQQEHANDGTTSNKNTGFSRLEAKRVKKIREYQPLRFAVDR